jgi:acyl carrier protein
MEQVQTLVRLQLGRRLVSAEDRFMEDLGAESPDLVNIIAAAEDKFSISFGEADISRVHTVKELYELIKNFCGVQGALDSAVSNNIRGGDTRRETSYAVIALQMPPHAVGFL